jgi:hypothetical protein
MKKTARSLVKVAVLITATTAAVVGVTVTPALAQPSTVTVVICETEPC